MTVYFYTGPGAVNWNLEAKGLERPCILLYARCRHLVTSDMAKTWSAYVFETQRKFLLCTFTQACGVLKMLFVVVCILNVLWT